MGDNEDHNGNDIPPKNHVRIHKKAPPKEETEIVEKEIPEPPAEDSENGND